MANRAEELGGALGVGAQTIYRYKRLGLTYPAEGESVEAWVLRARAWLAQQAKPPDTSREQFATALGVGIQTLFRYHRLGLTYPAEGESIEVWGARARRWIDQNVRRKGPRKERTARA